jgi:hypothetical protein
MRALLRIHKRLEQVMGRRIDSLTADIADPALRANTAEALQKIKLVYLLGLWRQKGRLNQAEYDELEHLIMRSRLIPLASEPAVKRTPARDRRVVQTRQVGSGGTDVLSCEVSLFQSQVCVGAGPR